VTHQQAGFEVAIDLVTREIWQWSTANIWIDSDGRHRLAWFDAEEMRLRIPREKPRPEPGQIMDKKRTIMSEPNLPPDHWHTPWARAEW
jgi:hypothetical protein